MNRRKNRIPAPVITEVECWDFSRDAFEQAHPRFKDFEFIFDYPTVYVIYSRDENRRSHRNEYLAYVGETNDIVSRTYQHFGPDAKSREDWRELAARAESNPESVRQYIIGNAHFNKSLTLDVENRMMQYLLGELVEGGRLEQRGVSDNALQWKELGIAPVQRLPGL